MPYRMPMIKRRRIGYGRSNVLMRSRGSYAGRVLRSIGAPAQTHTFARPGQRLRLTNDGNNFYVNGNALNSLAAGQLGMTMGSISQSTVRGAFDAGLAQFFQFSFLNDFSDLANLYDNYRIKAVKLKLDLSYNAAPGETSAGAGGNLAFSTNTLPMLHYCIDPDDNTAPTTVNNVLAYTKSRSVRFGDKSLTITLTPRAQGVVSQTAVASPGTGFAPVLGSMLPVNTWFDCQNAQSVPHFGIKMFIENMPYGTNSAGPGVGTGQWNWVITATPVYILECKNIH